MMDEDERFVRKTMYRIGAFCMAMGSCDSCPLNGLKYCETAKIMLTKDVCVEAQKAIYEYREKVREEFAEICDEHEVEECEACPLHGLAFCTTLEHRKRDEMYREVHEVYAEYMASKYLYEKHLQNDSEEPTMEKE